MGTQVLMTEEFPIPHKCLVWDYCFLDEDEKYKLLFCIFCHQVVGYEKDGVRLIRKKILQQHATYDQKEYSEDILKDSV